jgi:beta-glucanase (GH16 family)
MKILFSLLLTTTFVLVLIACRPAKNASVSDTNSENGYKLVWAEEFNNNGRPDTSTWRFEKGFVRNEEAQWYQEDNTWCENGKLIIEARREQRANPLYKTNGNSWRSKRADISYTSSSINTSGHKSWLYGRFIMRGKINISAGLWPAWWTLGVSGNWPANGEIDIMEYYRKMILANVACLGTDKKAEWFSVKKPVDSLGGTAWASDFHIWRMDWDENFITIYLDDVLLNSVELTKVVNKDDSGINPFKKPHYMLLNLAIGGLNGGNPDSTFFPNRFEVDYVRVYQK